MKLKSMSKVGTALVALLAISSAAQAAMVTGIIDIGAFNSEVLINKTLNSVTFQDNGAPAGNAQVNNASGGFSGFFGQTATYSDFVYSPSAPVAPLWILTSGLAQFNLTAITSFDEAGTGLVLTGVGTFFGASFDPTPGTWSFSADQALNSAKFTFSSQSAATPSVPDGGTTLVLLGGSLLGLGQLRRKLARR